MKKVFKTNQGELSLEISGDTASGTYQKDGVISGEFIDNTFKGQWENKGLQGLMEFTIQDKKLLGSWKKGTEPGPMRGTWKGELIEVESSTLEGTTKKESVIDEIDELYEKSKEIILDEGAALPEILVDVLCIGKNRAERIFLQLEKDGIVSSKDENGKRKIISQKTNTPDLRETQDEEWTIIHDIAVYYVLFGMESASYVKAGQNKDSLWCAPEWNYITEIMPKWEFKINGKVYGVQNGSENLEAVLETVYNSLYMDNNEPNKDPFIQLNISHSNLCNYFNEDIFIEGNVKTLLSSCFELCTIRDITEFQEKYLRNLTEQWNQACSSVESIIDLLDLLKQKNESRDYLL